MGINISGKNHISQWVLSTAIEHSIYGSNAPQAYSPEDAVLSYLHGHSVNMSSVTNMTTIDIIKLCDDFNRFKPVRSN